jgi:phosphatidylserine decarboxylase
MSATRTFIAREGQPLVLSALIAAAAVHYAYGWLYALPLWLLSATVAFMFRNPVRPIPSSPLAVVSPVDGRVVAVEQMEDPYLKRSALRIVLCMSALSVYFSRSPIEGKVLNVWRAGGSEGLLARITASGRRTALWIQTDEGDDVVFVMEHGLLSRPRCYAHTGERLGQGQRCGYIPFGGCIEVLLPTNARIERRVGGEVLAGSDVLATLVHK